ncbi:MAG: hypothetical protein ACXWXW_00795 [Bacteroidia bacterium]
MTSVEIILAIISSGAGGSVTAYLVNVSQRKKVTAETENLVQATYSKMVADLTSRIKQLECEVKDLKEERNDFESIREGLLHQIKQLEMENIKLLTTEKRLKNELRKLYKRLTLYDAPKDIKENE